MSIILDPLLDNPDAYQVALVKKILDKIKQYDDGLTANGLANDTNVKKEALQNINRVRES